MRLDRGDGRTGGRGTDEAGGLAGSWPQALARVRLSFDVRRGRGRPGCALGGGAPFPLPSLPQGRVEAAGWTGGAPPSNAGRGVRVRGVACAKVSGGEAPGTGDHRRANRRVWWQIGVEGERERRRRRPPRVPKFWPEHPGKQTVLPFMRGTPGS